MTRKFTILLLALMATIFCNAQNIKAFVTSGATLSQIDGDEVYGFRKFGYVGSVGALIPLESKERWLVSIETMFSQRGSREERYRSYHYKVNLPYIEIPLMAHFADPKGGWTFGLGFSYSRLLGNPKESFYFDSTRFVPNTETPYLKNDFSIIADIRFTIWRGLKFNVRYQYSMAPIKKDWEFLEYNDYGAKFSKTRDAYNNCLSARLIWVFGDNQRNNYGQNKKK